jgi:prepilin-type N-terminal cleavage/methylation domain-containing protein
MKLKNTGFTILETVIVLAIISVIIGTFMVFEKDFLKVNGTLQQSLLNQQQSEAAIKQMVEELRSARTSDSGAYPILGAQDNSITFFSNVDQDSSEEEIRYFLQNTTLKKGIIKATGTPPIYEPAGEVILTLVRGISTTTAPLFEYYDKNFMGTTSPLTVPVNIPDIRMVKITLAIDENPNRLPEAIVLKSQVVIRNLKDN